MGFRDKGLGCRVEQPVTMPSTPAALDPPLTEREKERNVGEGWGGGREKNNVCAKEGDGEKMKERERE